MTKKNENIRIPEEVLQDEFYELYKEAWEYENVPYGEKLDVMREYHKAALYGETSAESFEDYLWENDGYHGSLYVCFEEFLDNEYQDREYMESLLRDGRSPKADKESQFIMENYDFYNEKELDLEK